MTRVFLHTFGCKANQYDTEVLRQALQSVGAAVVDDPGAADAAVVNSCTVTHVSEAKMRGLVRRIARRGDGVRTVVTGCAAALDERSIAALPGVVGVVGGTDPARVLQLLGLPGDRVDPVLRSFGRGSRAWLKVQDGCDEHCTFCATTLARGASRSRPVEEVVREAAALASEHEELVLTGVHIGSYGSDLAEPLALSELTERIISAVPRVRLRLSSLEATEVDDRLAALMVDAPERLAPHLHAPLQSGSDRLLKRMGRHWYTAATYRERVEWLAERLPAFGLGADVMVGFPGETVADHHATRALIEALPYTYLHVFPYSERPGAAAVQLGRPVEPGAQTERAAELRAIAARKAEAYRAQRGGGCADVVLLRRAAGWFEGLTEDYLAVYVSSDSEATGRFSATLRVAPDGTLQAEPL